VENDVRMEIIILGTLCASVMLRERERETEQDGNGNGNI
jgi:hypothetical protein